MEYLAGGNKERDSLKTLCVPAYRWHNTNFVLRNVKQSDLAGLFKHIKKVVIRGKYSLEGKSSQTIKGLLFQTKKFGKLL